MKSIVFFLGLVVSLYSCKKQAPNEIDISSVSLNTTEVKIPSYSFAAFEQQVLNKKSEKLKVINFWATWCVPCVKELPYFEKLNAEKKNVEVILVSLDFGRQKQKLSDFVKSKGLKSKIVHLDAPDANEWIPIIDKSWDGAIPVTLLKQNESKVFYGHSLTQEELNNAVNKFNNEKK